MAIEFKVFVLEYFCPAMGIVMASAMFGAPARDLRKALLNGSLGPLNPFPWAMQTGNCLGWVVYGYYTRDPFVVAGNIPGLILSFWLNLGASKLQYLAIHSDQRRSTTQTSSERWDASSNTVESDDQLPDMDVSGLEEEMLVMVPQERALLRILSGWAAVLVWAGWFSSLNPATIVGLVVNANLIFFYGAPLQTMNMVIQQRNSESIHLLTLVMNFTNTSFWIVYGLTRRDPVIIGKSTVHMCHRSRLVLYSLSLIYLLAVPNAIGLSLGIVQAVLCVVYPRKQDDIVADLEPLAQALPETDHPTEGESQAVS